MSKVCSFDDYRFLTERDNLFNTPEHLETERNVIQYGLNKLRGRLNFFVLLGRNALRGVDNTMQQEAIDLCAEFVEFLTDIQINEKSFNKYYSEESMVIDVYTFSLYLYRCIEQMLYAGETVLEEECVKNVMDYSINFLIHVEYVLGAKSLVFRFIDWTERSAL